MVVSLSRLSAKLKLPFKRKKSGKKYVDDIRTVDDIFRHFKGGEKKERFAVLAVGNDLKGDDGVGWHAADVLRKKLGNDPEFMILKTAAPENHASDISEFAPTLLIIIDAADFKKRPGTIKYIKEYQVDESFVSTHTTPLALFLKLYQADQPVKRPVTIIGIQKKTNDFGQPISKPVRKSGEAVAELIADLYKRKLLFSSLEAELENLSNPLRKISGRLAGKGKTSKKVPEK
jgi:hydrogenase maturation protease HycI